MVHILSLAIVFTTIIQPSVADLHTVDLNQTIPEDDVRACPGEMLRYTCTTFGDGLAWQVGFGSEPVIFNSPDQINTTMQRLAFTFLFVDIMPGTPQTFVSTATIQSVTSHENGLILSCSDGTTTFLSKVKVKVQPENCQGAVSCTANPISVDSSLTVISVSLISLCDQSCVKEYEFVFDNVSKIVGLDSPAANFTIDKNLGFEYVNQQIFTLNAENVRGAQPCTFSITEPSAILQIACRQECNQTTMAITLILDWDRPSLSADNCLDSSHVKWKYLIQVSDFVSSTYETAETHLAINGFPSSGEYSITITPTLPDLGLSGLPLSSTIVLNQTCLSLNNATESTSNIVTVVVVVVPVVALTTLLIMILVTLMCWSYQNQKKAEPQSAEGIRLTHLNTSMNAHSVDNNEEKTCVGIDIVNPCVAVDSEDAFKEEPGLSGDEVNVQKLLAMEQQKVSKLQEENERLIQESYKRVVPDEEDNDEDTDEESYYGSPADVNSRRESASLIKTSKHHGHVGKSDTAGQEKWRAKLVTRPRSSSRNESWP